MKKLPFKIEVKLSADFLPVAWPELRGRPMLPEKLAYAIAEAILVEGLRLGELTEDRGAMHSGPVFNLIAHGNGELEMPEQP